MNFSSDSTLPDIMIIEPEVYEDERGFFFETYQRERFLQYNIATMFVQDNVSISNKNVIRGMHYQLRRPQGKLIYVVKGEIFDVAVDIRRDSPTFGSWTSISLSSENRRMVFIPEGFAHGFCALSETANIVYKCTDYYSRFDEFGIAWNDRKLSIQWPVSDPILSEKDMALPLLKDVPDNRLPVMKR